MSEQTFIQNIVKQVIKSYFYRFLLSYCTIGEKQNVKKAVRLNSQYMNTKKINAKIGPSGVKQFVTEAV